MSQQGYSVSHIQALLNYSSGGKALFGVWYFCKGYNIAFSDLIHSDTLL